jgi:hypothetical protein
MFKSAVPFLSSIAGLVTQAAQAAGPETLQPVALREICVTNGEIHASSDGRLQIDSASSRAVLRAQTDPVAEIRFTYLGPSTQSKPLASGEMRRQIGIKLRAENTCNLVYATWHIEPDSRIAVSIKRNPGMSEHAQCHAGGYINIKPSGAAAPLKIIAGQKHVLRAELRGASLVVKADGVEAWSGDLGGAIADIDGPVGMRTDNGRFAFDFLAGPAKSGIAAAHCEPAPGD